VQIKATGVSKPYQISGKHSFTIV